MEFKEGQEVLVEERFNKHITTIKKITSKGNIRLSSGGLYNANGRMKGSDSFSYGTITNDEIKIKEFKIDCKKRRTKIAIKMKLANHSYSLETLQTINDMLKHWEV